MQVPPEKRYKSSRLLGEKKIKFFEKNKRNWIRGGGEVGRFRNYVVRPSPRLLHTGDLKGKSIPFYPSLQDVLRDKGLQKHDKNTAKKIVEGVLHKENVPIPRTVKPFIVNPNDVEPFILK